MAPIRPGIRALDSISTAISAAFALGHAFQSRFGALTTTAHGASGHRQAGNHRRISGRVNSYRRMFVRIQNRNLFMHRRRWRLPCELIARTGTTERRVLAAAIGYPSWSCSEQLCSTRCRCTWPGLRLISRRRSLYCNWRPAGRIRWLAAQNHSWLVWPSYL